MSNPSRALLGMLALAASMPDEMVPRSIRRRVEEGRAQGWTHHRCKCGGPLRSHPERDTLRCRDCGRFSEPAEES